ncbi:uncharacterized protein MONBRDRAFT_28595 [Monosiga brevicollis MX1]|uniref:Rho-GAP domain-containing protein n=1 Tax=Monosiga brevicollis TaxID=81824 RepID=A9V8M5_MONBE|nr:uncharacterized protein MONBRDRAFT_28595 [Monosiga brevicollis MX1]EDQ86170.1 predicted protein [Monosiga brevicollis MX1]|eukprot:XP_001749095.1 hypothetical protein [Monosiga brevicollis MX1]
MVLQHYNLTHDDLQRMMDKTALEVAADDLNGVTKPVPSGVSLPDDASSVSPASTASPSISRRFRLSRKSRPTSMILGSANLAEIKQRARSHSLGAATVLRTSPRRRPEGMLAVSRGEKVEVLERADPGLPDDCWLVRHSDGTIGVLPKTSLQYDESPFRFGTELVIAARPRPSKIPAVIESSIHFLQRHGVQEEDAEKDAFSCEAVATLLKQYLRSLPDPVFPQRMYSTIMDVAKVSKVEVQMAQLREIVLNYLPASHKAVLQVLLPFLHEVANHSNINKMDPNNLGVVFGPTLIRLSAQQAGEDGRTTQAMIDDEPAIKRLMATCITVFSLQDNADNGVPSGESSTDADALGPRAWNTAQLRQWLQALPCRLEASSVETLSGKGATWLMDASLQQLKGLGLPMKDVMPLSQMLYQLNDPRAWPASPAT